MVLPPKKDVILALLEQSSVYVHLDPRHKGARVPPQFKKQPQLVLQIGLNMPIPIRDLQIDDAGVGCTLSFSRTPFYCVMPWPSVFALVGEDGRAMVWPDDVPPEVATQTAARGESSRPAPQERSAEAKEAKPRAVRARGKREKPPEPRAEEEARDVRTKLAIVPEETAPEATEEEPAPPREGPTKPKRELPPYLRVVK